MITYRVSLKSLVKFIEDGFTHNSKYAKMGRRWGSW